MDRDWLVVENAKVHVDTGLVLADDVPVRLTRYLRTGRCARLKRLCLPEVAEPFPQPLVVGYNGSHKNYYHWLTQCLFSAWLWARSSDHDDALFLTPPLNAMQQQSWPFSRVGGNSHYQAPFGKLLSVPRAIVVPDAFLPGANDPSPRLKEFADEISEQVDASRESGPAAIYVSRRDSKSRRLSNEAELESALAQLGFAVVTLSGMSFQDQIRHFRAAKLVVSPHGAGLSNVIFCQPGTHIIELMPSVRGSTCFKNLSALCDLRYEEKLISASGERMSIQWKVETEQIVREVGQAVAELRM